MPPWCWKHDAGSSLPQIVEAVDGVAAEVADDESVDSWLRNGLVELVVIMECNAGMAEASRLMLILPGGAPILFASLVVAICTGKGFVGRGTRGIFKGWVPISEAIGGGCC